MDTGSTAVAASSSGGVRQCQWAGALKHFDSKFGTQFRGFLLLKNPGTLQKERTLKMRPAERPTIPPRKRLSHVHENVPLTRKNCPHDGDDGTNVHVPPMPASAGKAVEAKPLPRNAALALRIRR